MLGLVAAILFVHLCPLFSSSFVCLKETLLIYFCLWKILTEQCMWWWRCVCVCVCGSVFTSRSCTVSPADRLFAFGPGFGYSEVLTSLHQVQDTNASCHDFILISYSGFLPAGAGTPHGCCPAKFPFSICARCKIAGLRALAYLQTVAKWSRCESALCTGQIGSECRNLRTPSLIKHPYECVFHKCVVDNDT